MQTANSGNGCGQWPGAINLQYRFAIGILDGLQGIAFKLGGQPPVCDRTLRGYALRILPLITGLLPIVVIHTSLLLAVAAGAVPACIPYLDGCTSISATGRYEPAVYLFKPALTAEAVLMILYWLLNVAWIRALTQQSGKKVSTQAPAIATLGIVGALALIIYVTFLGTQTPFYEFMRRFGIYFYFLCTVLAQLLVANRSLQLGKAIGLPGVIRISRLQLMLAATPFLLGVLNLILKSVMDDPDPAENIIEWIAALLMHVYFVLTCYAWADTGFGASLKIDIRGKSTSNR